MASQNDGIGRSRSKRSTGRVFQNLDDVRAAVAEFVELGYQTPIEARETYELRPAA